MDARLFFAKSSIEFEAIALANALSAKEEGPCFWIFCSISAEIPPCAWAVKATDAAMTRLKITVLRIWVWFLFFDFCKYNKNKSKSLFFDNNIPQAPLYCHQSLITRRLKMRNKAPICKDLYIEKAALILLQIAFYITSKQPSRRHHPPLIASKAHARTLKALLSLPQNAAFALRQKPFHEAKAGLSHNRKPMFISSKTITH